MIIYFADRKMNIYGQASTDLPNGAIVINDKKTEETDSGVAIFECELLFDENTQLEMETWANAGNYLLRKNDDEAEFYTIIETETDVKDKSIYIYAEDAGLDLLNEIVGAYSADKAYPASFYIEKFAYDSGFVIGLNEISNLTRKLKWEGEQTATARLQSVVTQFDNAELTYSFEVENLCVVRKYINIHKRIGKDVGTELRLNRDINNIITKKSVANLATAYIVTGGTPEGKEDPINLNGYKYDDGDFYIDGTMLKSRKALEKWSRYLSESGTDVGHIVQTYTYDTTSQSELCNRAVSSLKKVCDMEVNYEVDIAILPKGTEIGDMVNIVDDAGELYLSARVLKLEVSVSNKTQKATLGEYLIKGSGISQKLEELAEQFKNIAESRTLYTWTAYADDAYGAGISFSPDGKKYMGTAVNRLSEAVDISDPSIFTWVKVEGPPGKDGADGEQGPPGKDGENGAPGENGQDGKTSYLHIKYSNDGGKTFTGNNGKEPGDYIGQYTDFTETDSLKTTRYSWSKIRGEDGKPGEDGRPGTSGIIISPTAPVKPEVGQLWQTESGQPIKRWDGVSWVLYYIAIDNLDVKNLSAISADLGTVVAGIIKNTLESMIIDVNNGTIFSQSEDKTKSVYMKRENLDMIRAYTNARYHGARYCNEGLYFYSGGKEMADDIATGTLDCQILGDEEFGDLKVSDRNKNTFFLVKALKEAARFNTTKKSIQFGALSKVINTNGANPAAVILLSEIFGESTEASKCVVFAQNADEGANNAYVTGVSLRGNGQVLLYTNKSTTNDMRINFFGVKFE